MTNQPTRWVSIREAALALGVSELTVRRRIKDGRVAHQLINGKYYLDLSSVQAGGQAREEGEITIDIAPGAPSAVTPAMPLPPDPGDATAAPPDGGPAVTLVHAEGEIGPMAAGIDLDGLVAEHARLAEMAGRARLLEEQLAELSARHEALRDSMLTLAGRNGWLEGKLEERESELKLLTDEQPRRSWWKRLFGAT